MDIVSFVIFISVLIFSVVLHEVSHGAVAYKLGDNTAKMMGRLTLNPLPHIDLLGSIIVPLVMAIPALFGGPAIIFGWAKPVPYNPYNLRYKKWGPALVGIAGPATNISLAVVAGLLIRLFPQVIYDPNLLGAGLVLFVVAYLNIILAIFNLVPIPPLDGSKLLFSLFPLSAQTKYFLERNGFLFLLLFIFFGFQLIVPIIRFLFTFITGIDISAAL
ncbi:MAG: site-2 protease family protein [Candidatus Spechtbacterales bacterium]